MSYQLRYRDYKTKAGTYLVFISKGGKQQQLHRVSARKLSRGERRKLLEQMNLSQAGYIANGTKFVKQIEEDHIREINTSGMNTTITDITRDPQTKRWVREKIEDRDFVDNINPDEIKEDQY